MNLTVEYKDTRGTITCQRHHLTRPAFAKHLAIAGQGYSPKPKKLIRTIAMFFHYCNYIQPQAFNNDRFSEPPVELSDPTEKGHFSNLAGKAIADFLSKRINKSIYTVNHEAAMRMNNSPIPLFVNGRQVKRPDLLAFTKNSIFAIEAKGFSGSYGDMNNHKKQSQTGGIRVNFTIASVSYDLYNQVKCKYHDPFNDNVSYDNELLRRLTKEYYSGLSEFLNEKYFNIREIQIQGEKFYEIELSSRKFDRLFHNKSPFINLSFWIFEFLEYYRLRIILPSVVRYYAENGITNETKPFIFESKEQDQNTYIDNDRIGLRIRL
ncbi:hypothetical protein [Thermoflavifilum thermophilum]|uniref:Uncharacterized protein n=1 Tax=Thermoflavifilum thermophilum TaxID=1393122 RepID=A0A1I7NI29_9BACT|nr:hypothetical protein [Thermoflavifilum thermophilum]SFV34308.1 hypothetical protein SAMN05660895_1962 [Thermoflavifilum thermophilum]